jgi:hypothetical protein
MECTPPLPSSSPIRRIIDDSIGLTGALAFKGWGLFSVRADVAGPDLIEWQFRP